MEQPPAELRSTGAPIAIPSPLAQMRDPHTEVGAGAVHLGTNATLVTLHRGSDQVLKDANNSVIPGLHPVLQHPTHHPPDSSQRLKKKKEKNLFLPLLWLFDVSSVVFVTSFLLSFLEVELAFLWDFSLLNIFKIKQFNLSLCMQPHSELLLPALKGPCVPGWVGSGVPYTDHSCQVLSAGQAGSGTRSWAAFH